MINVSSPNMVNKPTEYARGKDVPFERIRRITGYISGSLSTWGSSKRAEERDRVKHVSEKK